MSAFPARWLFVVLLAIAPAAHADVRDTEAERAVAEGLRDGIWLDVHLSAVGKEKPALAPLLEPLEGVSLR